jgi:hypothetical protein
VLYSATVLVEKLTARTERGNLVQASQRSCGVLPNRDVGADDFRTALRFVGAKRY